MISPSVQKLITQFQEIKEHEEKIATQPKSSTINTDEVVRKVAAFYERIRKVVDWREEHLMRRVAIKRILKRRNFLGRGDDAENLIIELIRGGHFPNETIKKSKIEEVKKILDKYEVILQTAEMLIEKNKRLFWSEVCDVASCEIEETLDGVNHKKMNAMVEFMEDYIGSMIIIGKRATKDCPLTEENKKEFIYIAIQQALLNLDEQLIYYNLLKRKNPNWRKELPNENLIREIINVINDYEKITSHRLFNKFYSVCEQNDTPVLIIGDIISASPDQAEDIIYDEESLRKHIRKSYEKRLARLKGKTTRSAVYSTISVFLGNLLSLYVIEIPFTLYVMGSLNPLAKILTIVIPTLMMFVLVVTIRPPSAHNYRLVIDETKKIITGSKDTHEVDLYPNKKIVFKILVGFFYFVSVCLSILLYGYFLYYFAFPPLSSFLFIAFTALILFAGIKIRRRARELHIEPPREGFFSIFNDLLSLPIIRFGRWLTAYWRRFNIVSITFNFLIELPFMTFINFIESWRYFIKEKKEDIH